jgi:hypothetical protein
LVAWSRKENTRARWNPLATTLRKPGSTDFNLVEAGVAVQDYPDRTTGIEATAETLSLGHYLAIIKMLRGEVFDREGIRTALNTWSGNGDYVPSLITEWGNLWEKLGTSRPTNVPAAPSSRSLVGVYLAENAPLNLISLTDDGLFSFNYEAKGSVQTLFGRYSVSGRTITLEPFAGSTSRSSQKLTISGNIIVDQRGVRYRKTTP